MKEESKIGNYQFNHVPVLADELLQAIKQLTEEHCPDFSMIDATIGGGGHSKLILSEFPRLSLTGLDQDPEAIQAASERLKNFSPRTKFFETNFADFTPQAQTEIVFADLGVSSPQIDQASRGFSFRLDGPIDMRMSPSIKITAAELLSSLNENDLANLIYNYGDERFSRRIARKIKNDLLTCGPYKNTAALAYAIAGCYPKRMRYAKIHPATRTFQALRIAVNNEINILKEFLNKAPNWLKPGGILVIISFHSLEDREVKISFNEDKRLQKITRKPIQASQQEIEKNPRSRSAKLRIARKLL